MPPLISCFSPCHITKYLAEAYRGLLVQDYPNFEWVILANGPADPEQLKKEYAHDPRVRVFRSACGNQRIGALKREACGRCTGDIFLEHDADDILVPFTLPKVAAAYEAGAGFIYSDSAVFEDDLVSWGYAPAYGWEHYPVTVYGHRFTATRCFPLSPRMLCEVYYAPDHLRAWSRKAYYAAGGHNQEMPVGDDHDLICRTYLNGTEFRHIGCCGYLYRWHDNNTVKARSAGIAKQTAENKRRYLLELVANWCAREGHARVDLLTLKKNGGWRIPGPLPLAPNSCGQIMASDVLQFVPAQAQVAFFNECYAALVPGGFLHVAVPSEKGRYATMNPLHVSRFNQNSFLFYSRREFAQNMPGVDCRFDAVCVEDFYPDAAFKKHDMLMLRADLCAIKEGTRHPGPVLI